MTMQDAQKQMNDAVAGKAALLAKQAAELAALKAAHKAVVADWNKAIAKAGRRVAAVAKADSVAQAEKAVGNGQ